MLKSNAHLELEHILATALSESTHGKEKVGFVRALGSSVADVADAVTKLLLQNQEGRPTAVALYAPAIAPQLIARAMERARQAKQRLGPEARPSYPRTSL